MDPNKEFKVFITEYYEEIVRRAIKWVQDRRKIEDVHNAVHEVYLRFRRRDDVLVKLQSLERAKRLSYVLVAVRNQLRDLWRAGYREREVPWPESLDVEAPLVRIPAENVLLGPVIECLKALSLNHRTAVLSQMCRLALAPEEWLEILSVSLEQFLSFVDVDQDTIDRYSSESVNKKSRFHLCRGRAQLRNCLLGKGVDPDNLLL
jgi:DNA-directed RNA polymerase specialized sigma24 family protein